MPFEQVRREHAFLFEGVSRLDVRSTRRVYPAALQWSRHQGVMAVGDAALARDALSSQGLSCAISEARYAAAVSTRHDAGLFQHRLHEQRLSHLRSLSRALRECRCARETGWAQYTVHVLLALAAVASDERPSVGLRHGSLVQLARVPTAMAAVVSSRAVLSA